MSAPTWASIALTAVCIVAALFVAWRIVTVGKEFDEIIEGGDDK